jgi:hypothetical protein
MVYLIPCCNVNKNENQWQNWIHSINEVEVSPPKIKPLWLWSFRVCGQKQEDKSGRKSVFVFCFCPPTRNDLKLVEFFLAEFDDTFKKNRKKNFRKLNLDSQNSVLLRFAL